MSSRVSPQGLFGAFLAALLLGCGGAALHAAVLPGAESRVAEVERVYVVARDGEDNGVEEDIRDELRAIGLASESGPGPAPAGYDAFVTYIDRYSWDTTTFCIQLTLYLHDAETGHIVATGNSFRPSLIRETSAGHARLILQRIFGGGA